MLNVNAPQMAIIQLGQAFRNFFAGRAKHPIFRRKGVDDRFTLTNDQFQVAGRRIRIPHLGWVRMREEMRFSGKIASATVSRRADRWFVSITVDTEDPPRRPAAHEGAVGVDLGLLALATLSTSERIPGPKALRRELGRLRRLSRSLSRKQMGSTAPKRKPSYAAFGCPGCPLPHAGSADDGWPEESRTSAPAPGRPREVRRGAGGAGRCRAARRPPPRRAGGPGRSRRRRRPPSAIVARSRPARGADRT